MTTLLVNYMATCFGCYTAETRRHVVN